VSKPLYARAEDGPALSPPPRFSTLRGVGRPLRKRLPHDTMVGIRWHLRRRWPGLTVQWLPYWHRLRRLRRETGAAITTTATAAAATTAAATTATTAAATTAAATTATLAAAHASLQRRA